MSDARVDPQDNEARPSRWALGLGVASFFLGLFGAALVQAYALADRPRFIRLPIDLSERARVVEEWTARLARWERVAQAGCLTCCVALLLAIAVLRTSPKSRGLWALLIWSVLLLVLSLLTWGFADYQPF
jgi:peptidoglycan/LPS O-acetylase OafA/YrhL